MGSDELTMVLVTRKDLKLSKGKLAAQCSHAAVECALKAKRIRPNELSLMVGKWRAQDCGCSPKFGCPQTSVLENAKPKDWSTTWFVMLGTQRFLRVP